MAIVEKAMLSYSRKGLDTQKVHEALLKAVTALKTEGLDDLGVHVNKTGIEMDNAKDRAELFRRIMEKLKDETKGMAEGQQTAAERTTAAGVAFVDATDRMKEAVGKLAVSLTPLIEKAAKMLGLVGDLSDPNKGGRASLHAAQEG
jgi:BioD-like phosphotransacetylase family protein